MKPEYLPVIVLFGPTASGKTAILEELFLKNPYCSAEIISADSMQVYRGMDIGTAKPSLEERTKLPHHLIDIKDIREQFNSGDFVRLAVKAIHNIKKNNKLPVVSGGTGFYIKNLIMGLPASPASDPKIRKDLKQELRQKGSGALMDELILHDPVSAAKIHINDEYRLLRALEVLRSSGKPLSSYSRNDNSECSETAALRFLIFGLYHEREALYKRINERCKAMFEKGLAQEVRGLYECGFTPDDPGMRAIGYREFFLKNNDIEHKSDVNYLFCEDVKAAESLISQNSRRYAKRQNVFFASIPDTVWVDAKDIKKAAQEIKQKLDNLSL